MNSPLRRHVPGVALLALVVLLAMAGSATATLVITGKQIKNNSLTGKDIKNGSLRVADFKAADRAELRGPAGPIGPQGPAGVNGAAGAKGDPGATGASAFAPPPSGTVIKGGEIYAGQVSSAVSLRLYAALPFSTATPLVAGGPSGNLYFGASPLVNPGSVDTTKCGGTYSAPAPSAGNLCVYISYDANVALTSVYGAAGSLGAGPDGADSSGFYAIFQTGGAGITQFHIVWAYKAP